MPKLLRITTLVTMLFAALPAAQATPQSYSFLGTLNSIQFSGSFSFDDSQLAIFNAVEPLLTVAPVTSLSMTYNDVSYSLLDAWGPPDVSYYDGAFLGLSYSNDAMTFVPGLIDTSDAYVTDGLNSTGVIYAAVPEPESYALLLAGLGLMGLVARRRSQHV